ncbi:MAG: hypothetical protein KC996_08890 [Phycisphaerales bacterium]|nr:hypothetical protein [Phycisphaerales bacterium]
MSNENPLNLNEMTLAAKIRACADGELRGDECAQLKAYLESHPDAARQLGFEKELKSCCERVLRDKPCCPEALRAKITSMCCGEQVQAASAAEISDLIEDPAFAQGIESSNEGTRARSFWLRSSVISTLAAGLVIVAGVLVYQAATFKPTIPRDGMTIQQTSYVDRVGDFVVREHNRCCNDDAAAAKLIRHDINEATAYFSEAFGRSLVTPDLADVAGKVSFYGGGDCHVPSTPRSGHLRFDAVDDSGNPIRLSLFVATLPKEELLPMQEGMTYRVNSASCADAGASLFAWKRDGIMYLLVSEASDSMCSTVRRVMQAPTALGEL